MITKFKDNTVPFDADFHSSIQLYDEKTFKNIFFSCLQMLKMKKHEELETPTFTTSIPIDISE